MGIICNYCTDKGLRKEKNQDSLCIKVADTPIGTITMAVLCDGMGGLNNGEIASAIAVQTYGDWFDQQLPALLQPFSLDVLKDQLEKQMILANTSILAYGRQHSIRLRTTCSVLFLIAHYFYIIVHIGDTRIYEIREDVRMMTVDHTLVQREVTLGHLAPEAASEDSRRNILLQCLGDKERIRPEVEIGEIRNNSVYLLCSDGFYQTLRNLDYSELFPEQIHSEEQIHSVLKHSILRCRERKEKDDITAIAIKINA